MLLVTLPYFCSSPSQTSSFVQQYFQNMAQDGRQFLQSQASVVQMQDFPRAGLRIRIDDTFLPCQGDWDLDKSWGDQSFISTSPNAINPSAPGLDTSDCLESINAFESPVQTHLFSPLVPQLNQIVRHHTQRAVSLSPHAVTVFSPSVLPNAMTRVQTAPVEQTESLSGLHFGRRGRASRFGTHRRPSTMISPDFQFRDREIPRARVRSIY